MFRKILPNSAIWYTAVWYAIQAYKHFTCILTEHFNLEKM